MTDMKISVEAVEAARTGYLSVAPEAHMIAKLAESLEAALTYYAAHPEELPQEVLDAVRRPCGNCNGTGGVTIPEGTLYCPICEGTGFA